MMRRAGLADADAVRDLTRAAYAPWGPLIGREPMPMRVDYARAVLDHRIDLLEEAGHLVALIEMVPHPDHLWLENLAVHPDHQGRGLGRHLMRHAEAVAAELGLTELRLLTNAAFAANLRLYDSLGFAVTARTPFMGGFTVYFARKL